MGILRALISIDSWNMAFRRVTSRATCKPAASGWAGAFRGVRNWKGPPVSACLARTPRASRPRHSGHGASPIRPRAGRPPARGNSRRRRAQVRSGCARMAERDWKPWDTCLDGKTRNSFRRRTAGPSLSASGSRHFPGLSEWHESRLAERQFPWFPGPPGAPDRRLPPERTTVSASALSSLTSGVGFM